MSQSPPTAEEGKVLTEAGGTHLQGHRALQEGRLSQGGWPSLWRAPQAASIRPSLTPHNVFQEPQWARGRSQSTRGWRDGGCSLQASRKALCGSRCPRRPRDAPRSFRTQNWQRTSKVKHSPWPGTARGPT